MSTVLGCDASCWQIWANIATVSGAVVVSIAAIFALLQLRETATARTLESLSRVYDELSTSEMTQARKYVITEQLPAPGNISPDIYKTMHQVWASFEKVGFMVANNLIPERLVVEMYYGSVIRCWQKLRPYIERERQTRKGRYMEYFEHLYKRCEEYRDKYFPLDYPAE